MKKISSVDAIASLGKAISGPAKRKPGPKKLSDSMPATINNVRKAWMNPDLTNADISKTFGISASSIRVYAPVLDKLETFIE